MDAKLFTASNYNNHFIKKETYEEYIAAMQQAIQQARIDLTAANKTTIIAANSPYSWRPSSPISKGVLMVHGLYDSPFSLMEIAKVFYQQNYLIRGLLLPGHGTRPGDLLHTHYQDWIDAVNYGIDSLLSEVQQVFIIGFSLGGALASLMLLNRPEIRGGILIAPAFKTQGRLAFLADWYPVLSRIHNKYQWYRQRVQKSYAKYESFPLNAAYQARRLMSSVYSQLSSRKLSQPVMIVGADTDESVDTTAMLKWFSKVNNSLNRFLLYSNNYVTDDRRITVKTSHYPAQNIIDFSHICLPFSPENPHFGQHSDYRDYNHYPDSLPDKKPIIGSISQENLAHYCVQRLTYNPDFNNMVNMMGKFLEAI